MMFFEVKSPIFRGGVSNTEKARRESNFDAAIYLDLSVREFIHGRSNQLLGERL